LILYARGAAGIMRARQCAAVIALARGESPPCGSFSERIDFDQRLDNPRSIIDSSTRVFVASAHRDRAL